MPRPRGEKRKGGHLLGAAPPALPGFSSVAVTAASGDNNSSAQPRSGDPFGRGPDLPSSSHTHCLPGLPDGAHPHPTRPCPPRASPGVSRLPYPTLTPWLRPLGHLRLCGPAPHLAPGLRGLATGPQLARSQSPLSPCLPPHIAPGRWGPSSAACAQRDPRVCPEGPQVGCMALACRGRTVSLAAPPPVPGHGQGRGNSEAGPVGPSCPPLASLSRTALPHRAPVHAATVRPPPLLTGRGARLPNRSAQAEVSEGGHHGESSRGTTFSWLTGGQILWPGGRLDCSAAPPQPVVPGRRLASLHWGQRDNLLGAPIPGAGPGGPAGWGSRDSGQGTSRKAG